MAEISGAITNGQVTFSAFKPKIVEMHGRDHLERFREMATVVGHGLGIPHWRTTIEINSRTFVELVDQGIISRQLEDKIKRDCIPFVEVDPVKKTAKKPLFTTMKSGSSSPTTTTTTSSSSSSSDTTPGKKPPGPPGTPGCKFFGGK